MIPSRQPTARPSHARIGIGMSRIRSHVLAGALGTWLASCSAAGPSGSVPVDSYDTEARALSGMCRGRHLVVDPPTPLAATATVEQACAALDLRPLTPAGRGATTAAILGRWAACPSSTASVSG